MNQVEDKQEVLRDEKGRFVKKETYGEDCLENAFERQRRIAEFSDDKEAIVYSVQSALKERNYREAQEIVERYKASLTTTISVWSS